MQNIKQELYDNAFDNTREILWENVRGDVREKVKKYVWDNIWNDTGVIIFNNVRERYEES